MTDSNQLRTHWHKLMAESILHRHFTVEENKHPFKQIERKYGPCPPPNSKGIYPPRPYVPTGHRRWEAV